VSRFGAFLRQQTAVLDTLAVARMDTADIEESYERWLRAIAPGVFRGEFAEFHRDYWEWLWPIQMRRRKGEPIADLDSPLSALVVWGRGLAKSTSLEFTAASEGALCDQAFGIYISSTQDKANEHVAAIRDAIEASQVARYYPGLSNPRIGKFGNQRGWRQDAIYTDSQFAIVGAGLDKGIRGLKDIKQRPTIFLIDDVDEREDTPLIVEKKWKTLVHDVIPMASLTDQPLVIFAQNLIHRTSVMAKTLKREIPLLGHRREFGPVNTFQEDLQIEKRGHRSVIIAGTPNWLRMGVKEAQILIDDIGEQAFRSECQNDMTASKEERVLSEYDEQYHVITWSMFEKVFGTNRVPAHWEVHDGHDWGTTGPQAHPAVYTSVAVAAQDSPLPGDVFVVWGRCFDAGTTEHQIARAVITERRRYLWHPGAEEAVKLLITSDRAENEDVMWELRWRAGQALPLTSARMSHEASSERLTYQVKWGLPLQACDSGKLAGLSQIRHYLEPDRSRRHPFKPEVMGKPSMYLVVDDDQLLEMRDDQGLKRHREEALTLRWDPNIAGRDVPMKRGDDAVDSLKMIFQGFPLNATELDEYQKREAALAPNLRLDTMQDKPYSEGWEMSRARALAVVDEELDAESHSEFERFWSNTV
jgi:hypothetical protein